MSFVPTPALIPTKTTQILVSCPIFSKEWLTFVLLVITSVKYKENYMPCLWLFSESTIESSMLFFFLMDFFLHVFTQYNLFIFFQSGKFSSSDELSWVTRWNWTRGCHTQHFPQSPYATGLIWGWAPPSHPSPHPSPVAPTSALLLLRPLIPIPATHRRSFGSCHFPQAVSSDRVCRVLALSPFA